MWPTYSVALPPPGLPDVCTTAYQYNKKQFLPLRGPQTLHPRSLPKNDVDGLHGPPCIGGRLQVPHGPYERLPLGRPG